MLVDGDRIRVGEFPLDFLEGLEEAPEPPRSSTSLGGFQATGPDAGAAYGAEPYGGQPAGGDPFAAQPVGGDPYAAAPLGGDPYAAQPMGGGDPYAAQPMGATDPPFVEPEPYNPGLDENSFGDPYAAQPLGGGGDPFAAQPVGGGGRFGAQEYQPEDSVPIYDPADYDDDENDKCGDLRAP